jgi:hypothetical protein
MKTATSVCLQKTETANFHLFSASGKGKTEVCFHWSAKDKQ